MKYSKLLQILSFTFFFVSLAFVAFGAIILYNFIVCLIGDPNLLVYFHFSVGSNGFELNQVPPELFKEMVLWANKPYTKLWILLATVAHACAAWAFWKLSKITVDFEYKSKLTSSTARDLLRCAGVLLVGFILVLIASFTCGYSIMEFDLRETKTTTVILKEGTTQGGITTESEIRTTAVKTSFQFPGFDGMFYFIVFLYILSRFVHERVEILARLGSLEKDVQLTI